MATFEDLEPLAAEVLEACRARGWRVGTAESCTGGLIAASLTAVPGSSSVVERGFVTYSNEAKVGAIGVDPGLIVRHGAVSAEVARAMARGVLAHAFADLSLSVTGIAGPGGGSDDKPVGLVYFATAVRGGAVRAVRQEFGAQGRAAVRLAASAYGLELLLARASARG